MLTLINDDFYFSELINKDNRKVFTKNPYYRSEYDLDGFHKNFKSVLGQENVLCDLSLYELVKDYDNLELMRFDNIDIINDFSGFNAAIYEGFDFSPFKDFIAKTDVKIIDFETKEFENGHRYLSLNKELAFQKASKILLDAYDSGADFLLVADSLSFRVFDFYSSELSRVSNREFDDFYVLHICEFAALANNKILKSIKNHRLNVSLV